MEAGNMGLKRKQHHTSAAAVGEQSPLDLTFVQYALHLDSINEKRERLVKASRDITMLSKKVIFSVHRASSEAGLAQAAGDLEAIKLGHMARVARELSGSDYFHFSRSFSIGVQEFVEAATFLHFSKEGTLLSLDSLNASLVGVLDAEGKPFFVSAQDYVLGLADLSGEIMRLAVSGTSTTPHTSPAACRLFVQQLYAACGALPHASQLGREFGKKLDVMLQSLTKIEKVAYALRVRGSEYPPEMLLRSLDARESTDEAEG